MLRRPSESLDNLREEGCSSTAFGRLVLAEAPFWNNPASRGSGASARTSLPALP